MPGLFFFHHKGGWQLKLHHIGIIVSSIEDEVDIYKLLGYEEESGIVEDIIQNNRIIFLTHTVSKERMELD